MSLILRKRLMDLLSFQPVDEIPLMDYGYWEETIEAWYAQGLPQHVTRYDDAYFGLDRSYKHGIFHPFDTPGAADAFFPRFPVEVLADEGETVVLRDEDGVLLRQNKVLRTIPQYLRFPVADMQQYEAVRQRLNGADPARFPPHWDVAIRERVSQGGPVGMRLDGFFFWARRMMGLTALCLACYDQPALVTAIHRDHVRFLKDLAQRPLEAFAIDYVLISEDIAYKNGCFISPQLFRRFITPYYEELLDFLRGHGIRKILVDSDGDVRDVAGLFVEAGVDALCPCERVAGSDPVELRRRYPGLVLLGGVDKRALIVGPAAIDRELTHLAPIVADGGFLPHVDHQIPADVPLAHYLYYCDRRKELLGRKRHA